MLTVALRAVDRTKALRLRGLARGVPREAEMLIVPEHQNVAGRQAQITLRLGGVAPWPEPALEHSLGSEHAELVKGDPRAAAGDSVDEQAMIGGHLRMVHVETESGDQGDAERRLLGEVLRHCPPTDVKVLIDRRDDHPVGHAPALLPSFVLHGLVGEHEGSCLYPGEGAQFDLRVRRQDLAGAVR
ncbi:hypothetical protein ASF18_08760 [Methylobacterium sp. Leaf89]|nr:hypothetical protein ASF18_08760 [Methylobacterium sp. Leaf89]